MKKRSIYWRPSILISIGLIIMVIVLSFSAVNRIKHIEEERSFDHLYEEARTLAQYIEMQAQNDREHLEIIASMVAAYEDFTDPQLWEILDSYMNVGMTSRVEILLPGDTVLTRGVRSVDVSGEISFDEEAALGAHITDRERDLNGQTYILRHYVPVIRDGETVAMLYGVVGLAGLPDALLNNPYGGQAAVYIIDGSTGDFLMDTWHNEMGNIWDLGERPLAPGYNHAQLKQGLINGETGYVVFVSQTINRYLYFCYEPIGINNWRIALSVPEEVVFASADNIRYVLNWFLALEILLFVLYFVVMFSYNFRKAKQKQREIDTISYIYEVESLLFNAHEKQENILTALEKVARVTLAEKAGFWLVDGPADDNHCFLWEKPESANKAHCEPIDQMEIFRILLAYFRAGNPQFQARNQEAFHQIRPTEEGGCCKLIPVKNLMAIPIEGLNGEICGILAVCNMQNSQADPVLLKSVSFSFGMFCHNVQSHNAIKEMGERDALSGLYNRNRYEMDLPKYLQAYTTSLACVYVDVNGLHELNNTKGHEAGDRMLKSVSIKLQGKFGTQSTYRIGGDEFLAFVVDQAEETVDRLSRELEMDLQQDGIYISVGVQWQTQVTSMDDLIKRAEEKMYAAKKRYYEEHKEEWQDRDVRF